MTVSNRSNNWVSVRCPNPSAPLRLLCFPYAGAGPSVFSAWSRILPSQVEVCAIQMPGRERRVTEPLMTRMENAIDDLAEALVPWMDRPFVFFGHSVGALLAFELARRLRREGKQRLLRLIVSGRSAPHLPLEIPAIHGLADEEFVEELSQFAGTPKEVLQDQELMEIFIPILRADFRLGETYTYRDDVPLAVPISAYGGLADETVSVDRVGEWRRHTTDAFRFVMFPGGHFFLNENRAALLSEVAGELRETIRRLRGDPLDAQPDDAGQLLY